MRRILAVAGILGLVSLAAPTNAHAVTNGPLCITWTAWTACASINIAVSTPTTGTIMITNPAINTMGNNSTYKLTGFGFYNFTGTGPTVTLSGAPIGSGWSFVASPNTPGSLDGPISGESWRGGAESDQGSVPPAVGSPGSITVSYTASAAINWADLNWAWRGQAWTSTGQDEIGTGSIKCYSTGEASQQGTGVATCGPTTVIPEPGSMVLLATGLIGLGGMGFIRRRKQA